jgi:four helix bundle protein
MKERTFLFALRIIRLCSALTKGGSVARRLSGQLLDSGTSIGAMVEEAYAAQSRADFINEYNIGLKEARETNYWLRLITAAKLLPDQKVTALVQESHEIKQIMGSIVSRARRNNKKKCSHFFLFTFSFLLGGV